MLPSDKLAIINSFSICQPVCNHRAIILKGLADIGYNAPKHLWFYGFKVHILVTLSGYIVTSVVTPAPFIALKCKQSAILGDLGQNTRRTKHSRYGRRLW